MRSLIILEVEHGETTDALAQIIATAGQTTNVLNYTVKVDLPDCFELEK